jgi:hypothetical protein
VSKSNWRQSAAWFAALICATLVAEIPARADLSVATPESTSAGVVAQVTPVILDPASGRQIAVWSQFDGIANKIAYARLERGIWTDYHYLTFGPGNHTAPRIGITRDGAFLFWIADGRRYVSAPLDLASGRLHAAPRRVPLEAAGLRLVAAGSGSAAATEGGTDVPVVTECPPDDQECELLNARDDPRRPIISDGGSDVPIVTECPPDDANCDLVRSTRNDRRTPILGEGGTDIPVVVENETLWSVTSRPGCSLMIVSIPSVEAGVYHLLRFEGGRIDKAGRIRLLPGATAGLPAATAGPILDSGCF